MNIKNTVLSILGSGIILTNIVVNHVNIDPVKAEELSVEDFKQVSVMDYIEQIKEEYVITEIRGNEYFGNNEQSKVYFTKEYIESGRNINVGDTVTVYFENELDDSLVAVK